MKNKMIAAGALISLAALAGCATAPSTTASSGVSASGLPGWYLNPVPVAGGFAAAECVDDNASLSMLKAKATSLARAEIAAQMDLGVARMENSLREMSETDGATAVNEEFKQNARQVVSRELRASQLKMVDYFTDSRGQRLLCVFVEVDPTIAKTIYDQIVTETRRNLSPQSDTVLYREFTRKLTEQELSEVRGDVRS